METAIPLLPEIKLTCREGHVFTSRARGGSSVSCPVCRRLDGRRVSVWVPADRPKTARELAALTAVVDGQDQDHELAARWESEPEWDGRQLPDWPGCPGDACLECGGPLMWEPGRTWTDCEACAEGDGGMSLPAAVIRHYERRAEVATRSAGTVATRTDPAAEQAARVRLRALKDGARQRVESWLDTIAGPDSYDRVQYQRPAREPGPSSAGLRTTESPGPPGCTRLGRRARLRPARRAPGASWLVPFPGDLAAVESARSRSIRGPVTGKRVPVTGS